MPPPPRPQHDPFTTTTTTTALQPTSSNPTTLAPTSSSLRAQSSQHSLRSNASAASTRSRQQTNLFAPSLSRRPTSRATPDDVLADSDSEQDALTAAAAQQRLRQGRRGGRHGSPDGKHGGRSFKGKHEEAEQDFVNRQADGSFLLGVTGFGEVTATAVPVVEPPRTEEESNMADVDAHYVAISRHYFASGAAYGEKGAGKYEEQLEALKVPMMIRLREQVMQQLEEERWQHEPLDRYQSTMP